METYNVVEHNGMRGMVPLDDTNLGFGGMQNMRGTYTAPQGGNTLGGTGVPMGQNAISERDSYQSGGAAYQQELAQRDQQAQALATMRAGMGGGGAAPSYDSGSNLGFSSPQQQTQQQNPYLGDQAQAISNQMNNNWSRNLAPSIRSGAMAAGGFGGSRQGVVEANGLNDLNQSMGNSLAGLYGGAWNQQQNNNLQQQGLNNNFKLGMGQLNNQARSTANSYDLGLRSSDLNFANLDANINQNNFGNQMNSAQFGLNAYNTMGNHNTQATGAAGTVQNQPLNYFNNASDKTNGVANGYGSSTSSQNQPGNPMLGALGGAQLGSQLYNQFTGSAVQDNGYATGTGSAYAGSTDSGGAWSPNRRGM